MAPSVGSVLNNGSESDFRPVYYFKIVKPDGFLSLISIAFGLFLSTNQI